MQMGGLGTVKGTKMQQSDYYRYQQSVNQQMMMGNQLRKFAVEMFQTMSKNQKKKLEGKAKQFIENSKKDEEVLYDYKSRKLEEMQMNENANMQIIDSPDDFEFKADPDRYLEEVKKANSRNQ